MKCRVFGMTLIVVMLASPSLGASTSQPTAKGNPWRMSYDEARKQAQDLHKPILACFVGSDWCPYCIRLLKEKLNTSDFTKWAARNVVLLIVDFPKKTPQDSAVKKRNQSLKEKFKVKGYPDGLADLRRWQRGWSD